jgi:hypothetical protein
MIATTSRGSRAAGLVLPKILEPIGCHFGVANRVHDIFMAHIVLEGSVSCPSLASL